MSSPAESKSREGEPKVMRVSRRGLLVAGAAAFLPGLPRATENPLTLVAEDGRQALLDEGGPEAAIWGYGGQAPGPLLRLRQGETLDIAFENRLPQPSTIHWHGIRIDNAMDGVAPLTQAAVPPGGRFRYRFAPPDAGTYWYHPHTGLSWEQLARGLYGILIVEERERPDVDRDLLFVADDWRLTEDGALDLESLGLRHDFAHAGRLGNVLTVNGKPYERYQVAAGERIRLRLVSSANARVLHFRFPGTRTWVMALDGQPTPPRLLTGEITLAPGQRADLFLDLEGAPGSEAIIHEVSGGPLACASLLYADSPAGALRSEPPAALPANPLAPLGSPNRKVDLVMQGGAMRFLQQARYQGELLDGRSLAMEHGQFWALNGVAGMPAEPLIVARRGETWSVRMVNDTAFPHVMHLHGHHLRELARSDGSPQSEAWRDSLLLNPGVEVEAAFVADNPGRWMFHCHMLEHQAAGMMTWIEVA